MSDLFDHRAVPLHRQIAAASGEVRQRERVYPRLVERGGGCDRRRRATRSRR